MLPKQRHRLCLEGPHRCAHTAAWWRADGYHELLQSTGWEAHLAPMAEWILAHAAPAAAAAPAPAAEAPAS